jgi:hypothetical protein
MRAAVLFYNYRLNNFIIVSTELQTFINSPIPRETLQRAILDISEKGQPEEDGTGHEQISNFPICKRNRTIVVYYRNVCEICLLIGKIEKRVYFSFLSLSNKRR